MKPWDKGAVLSTIESYIICIHQMDECFVDGGNSAKVGRPVFWSSWICEDPFCFIFCSQVIDCSVLLIDYISHWTMVMLMEDVSVIICKFNKWKACVNIKFKNLTKGRCLYVYIHFFTCLWTLNFFPH